VLEVVKGISISWANFNHETNTNQQGKWPSKLDTLITKKASLLGTDVIQLKKELKVVDIVKVEKDVKSKSELKPTSVGKVEEISPWIQKKKMEVADLLYVVGMKWRLLD
jgi:hypothetical protein